MGEEKGGRLLSTSYLLTYRGSELDDAALLTAYHLLVTLLLSTSYLLTYRGPQLDDAALSCGQRVHAPPGPIARLQP